MARQLVSQLECAVPCSRQCEGWQGMQNPRICWPFKNKARHSARLMPRLQKCTSALRHDRPLEASHARKKSQIRLHHARAVPNTGLERSSRDDVRHVFCHAIQPLRKSVRHPGQGRPRPTSRRELESQKRKNITAARYDPKKCARATDSHTGLPRARKPCHHCVRSLEPQGA